ncbi:MAG TPA: diadenylate cyclase CdaA [Candidatus Sumerlaeota bacterium]|nr:MAG: DNA integrity scanning protein DisA [candidate division BRC1 bacterium ADurb.BinA292]HOE96434.1 diadenylate cyclase CdaA [Candidatus Sumerlaeota bacterium]HOR28758.1 diadenylate cyclase CdaA [Candidatus Sumerlaeota bacterium]HPK02318.1 diadenylate cyclase CdaA [Candidatus Sumerlaeota bacterium]
MQELTTSIMNFRLLDLADILLVALFFYGIFAILRETRSFVALMGFVTFTLASLLLFLIALTWDLQAMILIFQNFWIVVVLIFLIVFQNEFRKALTDLGQLRLLRGLFPSRERDVLDEIINAVTLLAGRNIGALIVLERRNPLRSYMGSGTVLDATVSAEMIRTVFTPYSPLHDGAMLIRGERILAAGCILPLSDNPELSSELGTRHRAALGLSEETDAVVIVVSEETGTISLAENGQIQRNLKPAELRSRLEEELEIAHQQAQGEEAR